MKAPKSSLHPPSFGNGSRHSALTNGGGCSRTKWQKRNWQRVLEHKRKWRRVHHDQNKQCQRNYRLNNLLQLRAKNRKWKRLNPEKVREQARRSRLRHPLRWQRIKRRTYLKHRVRILATRKSWRRRHLAHCRMQGRKYYHAHRAAHLERAKVYNSSEHGRNKIRERFRQWISIPKNRLRRLQYVKDRYRTNIQFRLRTLLSSRIAKLLRRCGVEKRLATYSLVGTSAEGLKHHLESMFKPGMTWDKRGLWHIDHIRPCDSFDLSNLDEQLKCFHYTNLQPLWAPDNQRKYTKIA